MKRTIFAVAAIVGAVALTAAGCGDKYTEPFQDAPRAGAADNTPAQVITMPDGFSNLATKCVNGVRYTVAYHMDSAYAAVSTLLDPSCKK